MKIRDFESNDGDDDGLRMQKSPGAGTDLSISTAKSPSLGMTVKEYEKELQKYEAKDRNHIKIENQLQNHSNNMQAKLIYLKKQMDENQAMYEEFENQIIMRDKEAEEMLEKIDNVYGKNQKLEEQLKNLNAELQSLQLQKEKSDNQNQIYQTKI